MTPGSGLNFVNKRLTSCYAISEKRLLQPRDRRLLEQPAYFRYKRYLWSKAPAWPGRGKELYMKDTLNTPGKGASPLCTPHISSLR